MSAFDRSAGFVHRDWNPAQRGGDSDGTESRQLARVALVASLKTWDRKDHHLRGVGQIVWRGLYTQMDG